VAQGERFVGAYGIRPFWIPAFAGMTRKGDKFLDSGSQIPCASRPWIFLSSLLVSCHSSANSFESECHSEERSDEESALFQGSLSCTQSKQILRLRLRMTLDRLPPRHPQTCSVHHLQWNFASPLGEADARRRVRAPASTSKNPIHDRPSPLPDVAARHRTRAPTRPSCAAARKDLSSP
jgi:hypothetical protein